LYLVILVSWGIALAEYCFAVPANRIGHSVYNAAELKTMQEVITLVVFSIFSVLYLGEHHHQSPGRLRLHLPGAFFIFKGPIG
jgi:uncharacterized protein (DUF486 family)